MFRFDAHQPVQCCDGISRRDFLHVGALALVGLTLPDFLAMQAAGAVEEDKDVNCILIFNLGGPSHIDTWDPKPDAPDGVRSPFPPTRTNVPGIYITDLFPRMARQMDKIALVRSVYHTAAAVHDTGHQLMQTGRLFEGGVEHPHVGCVVSKLKGARGDLPAHVLLPTPIGPTGGNLPHGQHAGYLGDDYDPLLINADPSHPDFSLPQYIAAMREGQHPTLRSAVDSAIKSYEARDDVRLRDAHFHRAYALLSSASAREAFDLRREPPAVREKYGRNRFGQSCLLARRLVERGVRFVTINTFETVFNAISWDIHGSRPFTDIAAMKDVVAPWFDNGYSSLLAELHERGLLDRTLVVALGEFGRTPKINPAGGRDHWPQCWTVLFAGGGVRGGQVVGASDAIGAYPKDRPTTPAEIVASLYHALGINLRHELPGPDGKPVPLVDDGVQPIDELF
ncbi:MAG: DUF1501 domain-containing protein [Abditibacteriales bacterium]|nr:DUF1501 domain-containing protein [Abditibacteriales bacterium]MDW8365856.1 DUF1501 domain-containing protein [Abditibacteriales bacterium]